MADSILIFVVVFSVDFGAHFDYGCARIESAMAKLDPTTTAVDLAALELEIRRPWRLIW